MIVRQFDELQRRKDHNIDNIYNGRKREVLRLFCMVNQYGNKYV
jgi:hypothetical protein